MNFTEKNNNRKAHKGGDRQHVEARRVRRLCGGAFGEPNRTVVSTWGWNDLIVGTTGVPRRGGDGKE